MHRRVKPSRMTRYWQKFANVSVASKLKWFAMKRWLAR